MILLYIVILSSVTIPTVKSQGDAVCDCQEVGILKVLVQKVLFEQQMESARVSRLEARIKTYETTGPIPNDRLKRLEKSVNDINMKFNETVTGAKDKQIGFHRGIGTIVQKALISEKKERKKLVSSMNKIVKEYKDTIETFKEAINNTIDKRFQDITAEQVKYKATIETYKEAINKTIDKRFQDITAKQVDHKATIETYKEVINNTIDNRFQDITAKQVDYEATIETYKEAINNTIDNRFQDITAKQVDYKATIETYKEAINNTIDKRFQDITAEQVKYKATIETYKEAINKTIDKRFQDITAKQVDYKATIETYKEVINNTIDNRFQDITAKQVDYKATIETYKEAINNTIDNRFQDIPAKQVDYKATIETYKEAINNTIDNRFQDITAKQVDYEATIETYKDAINNTIDNRFQDITAKQMDYKATIETYKEAINNTIDNRFQDIAAEQRDYKATLETFKVSINKTIDERFEYISANQIKYRNEILLDLITLNETRYMVDTLGKIVEGGQVRLVNGSNQYEGRLEVWHDWSWRTVCDDGFDTLSASVVCRMLNFQHTNPVVFKSSYFGAGAFPLHLDKVKCSETDTRISQCLHSGYGKHNCSHDKDIGISCTPVRLVNGSNQYEGRLEVWHDGTWGTVCEDGFSEMSASVVCKMLNYPHTLPRVYGSAQFGAGASLIHLDNVDCEGTETSITQCRHNGWGINDCEHREDVGISCTPDHCKVPYEYDTRLSINDRYRVSFSGGSVVKVGDFVYFNCSKAGDDMHEPVNRRFKCINSQWIEDERDKLWKLGNNGTFPKCRKTRCEPDCENGGVCLRDDECKCNHFTSGKRCEKVICDDKCYANNGECVGPGKCQCPEGKFGTHCENSACRLPENKNMAKLTTPGTYFGIGETVRNFKCQMGHFPSPDRGMTCRSDGSWSDIVTCEKGKMYMISTKTGTRTGAGTNANVYITLFGPKGRTRRITFWGDFEPDDVDVIRTFARDVRPIHSVQIGHDGDNILSDWDLEYVSIYVEHMEEFYVFRNIKQQWVKKENDLTLHREGNQLCINTFSDKYMWFPKWKLINNFYLGRGPGMSSRACKQACIIWNKSVCNGVYRDTKHHSCYGFTDAGDEYFQVKNEHWQGELFFRTCKKFN